MTEQELQILREKGRANLAEGIRLAQEDFMHEIERIVSDSTLPALSDEEAERIMQSVNEKWEQYRAEKRKKREKSSHSE